MYLRALTHAVPRWSYRQPEIWQSFNEGGALGRLREGSREFLRGILMGDSGISKRHFAVEDPRLLFSLDAEALNRHFERAAPMLGHEALATALEKARILPADLDVLVVCTCTGYLCPGLSSFVAEKAGLRSDVCLVDLAGHGCGAAIPALRTAFNYLRAGDGVVAACLAVEISSAAFYLDDDAGVLVSAALFADGASASIWSAERGDAVWSCSGFQGLHLPEKRELLRFENREGRLRNRLHRDVPEIAAGTVGELHGRLADVAGRYPAIVHPGGKRVLEKLRAVLPGQGLFASEEVLRDYGNMSSPSVLIALEKAMQARSEAEGFWLASFGAGYTAHSCLVERVGD